MLTAVFSMRWVRGFDNQILEALEGANMNVYVELEINNAHLPGWV